VVKTKDQELFGSIFELIVFKPSMESIFKAPSIYIKTWEKLGENLNLAFVVLYMCCSHTCVRGGGLIANPLPYEMAFLMEILAKK
jgi:hypothetical protein